MNSYLDDVGDRAFGIDKQNRKVGGVCAGVAHYLDVPSLFVRVAAVGALLIAPEATLIAYGLAYFILDDISTLDPLDAEFDEYASD